MALSDAFYNELVPEVDGIIDELGTTYTIETPGAYNEDTLKNDSPTSRQVGGLVADQTVAISVANMAGSGLSSDATWMGKKVLILKASAAPKPTESVKIDGSLYPLSKVTEIKPADVTVVYMLDITR